jgi:hypothetical protein
MNDVQWVERLIGTELLKVHEQMTEHQVAGRECMALMIPKPNVKVLGLQVLFSDSVSEPTVLATELKGSKDGVQDTPLSASIESTGDESADAGPSSAVGDGNG